MKDIFQGAHLPRSLGATHSPTHHLSDSKPGDDGGIDRAVNAFFHALAVPESKKPPIEGKGVAAWWTRLDGASRRAWEARLGAAPARVMVNLATETDPQLFFQDLLALASDALNGEAGHVQVAALQNLAEAPDFFGLAIPDSIRSRAKVKWQVLQGKGPTGLRLEQGARNFVDQVVDPGTLLAMGLAAPAYSLTRGLVMERMFLQSAKFWNRGLALRLTAGTVGLVPEVLTFSGVHHGYQALFGGASAGEGHQDLLKEWGALAMTLGLFKVFGYAFGKGAVGLQREYLPHLNGELVQRWASGVGMYAGVLSSHYLEGRLGLRKPEDLSGLLWGAGVSALQLKVMGNLSHHLMGSRYGAWMRSLEHRAETLSAPPLEFRLPMLFPDLGLPALAPAGVPFPIFMSELGDGGKSRGFSMMMGNPDGAGPSRPAGNERPKILELNRPNYIKSLLRIYLGKETEASAKIRQARELYEDPELLEQALRFHFIQEAYHRHTEKNGVESGKGKVSIGKIKWVPTKISNQNGGRSGEGWKLLLPDPEEQIPGVDMKQIQTKVAHKLIDIRMDHLSGTADRLYEYTEKMKFVLAKLEGIKENLPKNTPEEIEKMDRLIHSVEIKQMQIARYFREAHALLADYKGPHKPSAFTPETYSLHQIRYQGFLTEVETYLQRNPLVREILQDWFGPPPTAPADSMSFEALQAEVREMDIPHEKQEFFRDAISYDPNLYYLEGHPLGAVFRKILHSASSEESLDLWLPIDRYLDGLQQMRRWTSREDIQSLNIDTLTNDPLGKRGMTWTRHQLEKILRDRFSPDSEEGQQAFKAMEEYLGATAKLRTMMSHFVPKLRIPDPLNWDEVRTRFLNLPRHHEMSEEAVQKILNWTEASGDSPRQAILHLYRKQFLTGFMDFVFNDHREAKNTRKIVKFMETVCDRNDVEMMTNLALRFHHFSFGELGSERADRDSAPPSQKVANGQITMRNERFLKSLLKMGEFYEAYPQFRGAYFEIMEKLNGEAGEQEARLVAPIDQRVRENLDAGYPVELLSRGSLGSAAIRVDGVSDNPRVLAITSIQNNLASRMEFNFWVLKSLRDLPFFEQAGEGGTISEELMMAVQIRRLRNAILKDDAVYWARDLLDQVPQLTSIDLYLPDQNSAVRNPFNPREFLHVPVTRDHPNTAQRVEALEAKLQETTDDVFLYLELYRHWTGAQMEPDILNPGMGFLIQAAHQFPGNRAVTHELRKNLDNFYKTAHELREHLLTDFTGQDHRESMYTRHRREIDLARKEGRAALSFSDIQSELGSANHFRRVEEVFYALIGKKLSLGDISQQLDLSPAGFKIHHMEWSYNNRFPEYFSLEGEIDALGSGFPFQRRVNRDDGMPVSSDFGFGGNSENGSFELKFCREKTTGKIRMEIHRLNLPKAWQMSGMGTLFLRRLIKLGEKIGADTLEYFDVSTSGKIALLKMGGRIKLEGEWERLRRGFPNFVERHAANQEWWGVDFSPATSVKNSQQLVFAHVDMLNRKLKFSPWYRPEGQTKVTYLDPSYQVGRLYLMSDPGMNWDVVFDLKPESSSRRTFAHYFSHRFNLGPGEDL